MIFFESRRCAVAVAVVLAVLALFFAVLARINHSYREIGEVAGSELVLYRVAYSPGFPVSRTNLAVAGEFKVDQQLRCDGRMIAARYRGRISSPDIILAGPVKEDTLYSVVMKPLWKIERSTWLWFSFHRVRFGGAQFILYREYSGRKEIIPINQALPVTDAGRS